jgi:drug/metabolite transporter (DMT)-like permease
MPTSAIFLSLSTIILWSFLAFLVSKINHIPSSIIVGVALLIGGVVGMVKIREWKVPWKTLVVGIGGIFGYHYLYFSAFKYAPAIEASLMNYLWPLLIVLLSPLYLPGYRIRAHHLLGALSGLIGAVLIITGGRFSLDIVNIRGYLLAAGAALVWSSYSLLTKRLPPFPSSAVGSFCFFSGLLSLSTYLLAPGPSSSLIRLSAQDWIYLIILGLGPMGLAFFTWDMALKRGDPRIIGSLTYLTPLLSTINLIVLGGRIMSVVSVLAMVLIIVGAVIGSLDLFRGKGNPVISGDNVIRPGLPGSHQNTCGDNRPWDSSYRSQDRGNGKDRNPASRSCDTR